MLALRKVSVHAYEDPGRPEGGHAIVLLNGIEKVPPQATFRLKPGDGTSITDAAGWPQGDLKPIECRVSADGLELHVGPDVTECDLLLPGTLVEIEVPGADARGEFLWPNIAPMLRPKRRTVIVNKPKRKGEADASDKGAAEPINTGKAETAGLSDAAVAVSGTAAGSDTATAAQATAGGSTGAEPVSAAPATTASEASSSIAFHIPGLDDIEALANAAMQAPAKAATDAGTSSDSAAASTETRPVETATAPDNSVTAHSATTAKAAAAGQPVEPPASVALRSKPAKAKAALPEPVRDPAPAGDEPYYPHARAGRASGAPSGNVARREVGSRRAANAAQAVAGLLAVVAALYVLSRESSMRTVAPQPQTETATIGVAAQGNDRPFAVPAPVTGSATAQDISLFDVLSVGAISPRGTSAASMGAARALDNANAQLSSTSRDTEEAAFWLRRYITTTLGNDRTMRALTQLGSVYAEPEGRTPDYGKARLLWEIASAAGDPVAMCFLGLLHENGLGGPADRKVAQQWYERSKAAGGCPGLDESLARVRQ